MGRPAQNAFTLHLRLHAIHHLAPLYLQGEVLPIEEKPGFDGTYTVKLDDGAEAKVPYYELRLLLNPAEPSSWARPLPESITQTHAQTDTQTHVHAQPDATLQPEITPQQQQQQCIESGASNATAAKVLAEQRSTQSLWPAGPVSSTLPAVHASAASKAQDNSLQEGEQVVPQLRRTKRSVAQKHTLSLSHTAGHQGHSAAGSSVQRKLSHLHADTSSSQTAGLQETSPLALAKPGLAAKSEVLKAAEQGAASPQADDWQHDSDDDLYVDLSLANIKPQSSRLPGSQLSAAFTNSMALPASRTALAGPGGAGSAANVTIRANEAFASPQVHRRGLGRSAKLKAGDDAFGILGLSP